MGDQKLANSTASSSLSITSKISHPEGISDTELIQEFTEKNESAVCQKKMQNEASVINTGTSKHPNDDKGYSAMYKSSSEDDWRFEQSTDYVHREKSESSKGLFVGQEMSSVTRDQLGSNDSDKLRRKRLLNGEQDEVAKEERGSFLGQEELGLVTDEVD